MTVLSQFLLQNRGAKRRYTRNVRERGQALLILLLVLAVSLTVVLSSASRSVTDIQTTGLEEDSLRAFNAAEVGIEEALIQQAQPLDEELDNGANYSVEFLVENPDSNQFVHPAKFFSGDTATFWFVSQDASGDLTCDGGVPCARSNQFRLCWGNTGTAPPPEKRPAIEVSVYYDNAPPSALNGNFANVLVARAVFDSNSSRASDNSFTAASGCPGGIGVGAANKSFPYGATINMNVPSLDIPCSNTTTGCLLMARVKFLYNDTVDHPLGIRLITTGGTSLPPQGAEIESTGVAGDSTRRINVYQSYPEIPSFFDSAVMSRGALTK